MGEATNQLASAVDVVVVALDEAYRNIPALLAALAILIAGWAVAAAVRALVRRVAMKVNGVLDRVTRLQPKSGARMEPGTISLLGQAAFWLVLLVAAAIAAQVAGFGAIAGWLGAIVRHLPKVVSGAAIIAIGYVLGIVAGEQVRSAASAAGSSQSQLVGRLVQLSIFVLAVITGLGQFGIDVTLVTWLLVVAAGAVFISFALAFALGARDFVNDVISARAVRNDLKIGTAVRIDDVQGDIIEVTTTRVALDTVHGKALLPARFVAAQNVVIVSPSAVIGRSDD